MNGDKRRLGRPPLPVDRKRVRMSIMMKPDLVAWLAAETERRGWSRSAVIEEAVAFLKDALDTDAAPTHVLVVEEEWPPSGRWLMEG